MGTDTATVKAQINPHFWADTEYAVEYGTAPCSAGGCATQPAGTMLSLGGQVVDAALPSSSVTLYGLQPGTTYHLRFVAKSGGGGPVYGIDPDGVGPGEPTFAEGSEATFTTFAPAQARPPCPANEAFRQGPSAALPDCRAYELVSPVDKEGGDIVVNCDVFCNPARLVKSSGDGDAVTYSSYRAFADPSSAPYASQYLGRRTPSGWATAAISPPREGEAFVPSLDLDTPYKAFSEDLSKAWLLTATEPLLAPDAIPGFANLYLRDSLSGGYSALTTVEPPVQYAPELQGFSADGAHAVFRANAKLTGKAANAAFHQLYEAVGGEVRLVSVKPNGTAAGVESSAGSKGGEVYGMSANVDHAVSADGSRIFWSEAAGLGEGKLYVRIDSKSTVSISSEPGQFFTANPSGTRAIFSVAEDLYEFDVEGKAKALIAPSVQGVLGWSEDANRIYFVSTAALAPGAKPGLPNLYLYQAGGSTRYIAQLSAADVEARNNKISPIAIQPYKRRSRVTPSGSVAVFMSTARLTGFDNTDAGSGEADAEVYRYDAEADTLDCVSCNPTGVRPSGRDLQIERTASGRWAAAQIPAWENQLYAPRALSAIGDRLFFESFEALVPEDTNGMQDVYEWEAPGSGDCSTGSGAFSPTAGGCVSLISSGQSPNDSEFIDAGAGGGDVFFITAASLVPQDPGQIDLYDARGGGGLPPPPLPAGGCSGEACQPAPSAPDVPTPSSSSFTGPGNPRHRTKPRQSRRKHHHRKRHRGNKHRSASRLHHAAAAGGGR